jgi:hypothetical protein
MTTKNVADKPPILRFLVLFITLMVAALGLAALSAPADATDAPGLSPNGSAQGAGMPSSERAKDSATSMPSTPADMIPPA